MAKNGKSGGKKSFGETKVGGLVKEAGGIGGIIGFAKNVFSGNPDKQRQRQCKREGRREAKERGLRGAERRDYINEYVMNNCTPTQPNNPNINLGIPQQKKVYPQNGRTAPRISGGLTVGTPNPLGNPLLLLAGIIAIVFLFRRK